MIHATIEHYRLAGLPVPATCYKREGLPIPDPKAFQEAVPIPAAAAVKRGRDSENVDALVGQVAEMQFGSPGFDDSPVKKTKVARLHDQITELVGNFLAPKQIRRIADAVIFAFSPNEFSPNKAYFYLEPKDHHVPFNIIYYYKNRNAYVDLECHLNNDRRTNAVIEIKVSSDDTPSTVKLVDATFKEIKAALLEKQKKDGEKKAQAAQDKVRRRK